jgi:CO dehydrogenase maturation factor
VRLMATGPFQESDLGLACYHSKVGADLLTCMGWSPLCGLRRRGSPLPFDQLEPATLQALEALLAEADLAPRDWEKVYRQAVEFHLHNARRWANAAAGEDLTGQVDPDFTLHPDLQPS